MSRIQNIPTQEQPKSEPTKIDKIAAAVIDMIRKGAGELDVKAIDYTNTLDGVAWLLKQEAKRHRAKFGH